MILNKIKTILLSRIKYNKEEEWVVRRLNTCLECNYNTLNGGILKGYRFFLANLSVLYSKLMGRSKEDGTMGYCNICGCDNFWKASSEEEQCSDNPPRWKRLEDGSIKLDVFKERKQKIY